MPPLLIGAASIPHINVQLHGLRVNRRGQLDQFGVSHCTWTPRYPPANSAPVPSASSSTSVTPRCIAFGSEVPPPLWLVVVNSFAFPLGALSRCSKVPQSRRDCVGIPGTDPPGLWADIRQDRVATVHFPKCSAPRSPSATAAPVAQPAHSYFIPNLPRTRALTPKNTLLYTYVSPATRLTD